MSTGRKISVALRLGIHDDMVAVSVSVDPDFCARRSAILTPDPLDNTV